MLLLKLPDFKSGAVVISSEQPVFQAYSARASAPAAAGALAVFNSKPLQDGMTQNTSYFVSRAFAEKRGFRLIRGGRAAAPCSRMAVSTPKF